MDLTGCRKGQERSQNRHGNDGIFKPSLGKAQAPHPTAVADGDAGLRPDRGTTRHSRVLRNMRRSRRARELEKHFGGFSIGPGALVSTVVILTL